MKNRKAKQMICSVWEHTAPCGVFGMYGYNFGSYLVPPKYEVHTNYGLCCDGYEMKVGVISLTADQLREVE